MRFHAAAVAALMLSAAPATAATFVRTAAVQVPGPDLPNPHFGGGWLLDEPIESLAAGDVIELNIVLSRPIYFVNVPAWPDKLGYLPAGFGLQTQGPVTYEIGGVIGDIIAFGEAATFAGNSQTYVRVADPATFTAGGFSSIKLTYTVATPPDRAIIGAYFGAIAYVPEPATWAMMILGFGAVGVSRRSRPSSPRATSLP